jgi:hypothetical protein
MIRLAASVDASDLLDRIEIRREGGKNSRIGQLNSA